MKFFPKMSPLNPQYHTKKQSVFEKISTFVEKFKGVGGVDLIGVWRKQMKKNISEHVPYISDIKKTYRVRYLQL